MSLNENLSDVGHQSSSVAQGIALADPASHYLIVGPVLVDCAQVARAEHLGLRLDDQVLVRDHPLLLDQRQLLHDLAGGVVDEGSGPGPVDRNDCVDLLSEGPSDEIAGVCPPDGEDASDCEVRIDDRAAIEGIVGDHKPFALCDLLIVRSFLAGKGLDQGIRPEMLLDYLIALDVLVQLLVAEQIGGLHDNHWRMPQKLSNLPRGIQHGKDNRGLFALQLWLKILHML